ncbi:MAG TPA: [protein-PII] uridylyltransferase [Kofleriaceae bacterium]|jgi:[protein-PII] uridylyltransferase
MTMRAALDATFAALPAELRRPGTGATSARAISDVYDVAIAERFVAACEGAELALVATGGWARRELAPYSDIDFIILHDGDEPTAKRVSDRLLYPLWDEKLAIGHAVREPRAVARLARDDLATATALLDARHIAGARALTAELVRLTSAALAPGGNPNELIAQLAAENKARHDRFGAAIYVLEPNLKQGIGALRDGSAALWAAGVRWHPPEPGADPPTAEGLVAELVANGHLTRRQGDVLDGARDFQLRLRALVQLATKRRTDQLTFELQESLGPSLYPHASGSGDSAVAPAVEALMRDYYLHARALVQVVERLLESARVPAKRKPRVTPVDDSFVAVDGELAVTDPNRFAAQPAEMARLFRVAVAAQLPVAGDTRELVAETIARDPSPLVADATAARCVLEALVDLRDCTFPSAFERMHQVGILSAILPGWAPCTARVQHDLYHVYTVDQHQLYALAMQKRLARGELAAEHPFATELWKTIARPAPLLLATLLHDVGKPLGKGHAEKGAVIAGTVARRLALPAHDIELVEFLVRQHLTMSHLSQRRDLADADVIARFAERVGSDERLVALYLLTLCDTAMTAPDNLSAWKADLLHELTVRTRALLRGGPDADHAEVDPRANVHALVTAADERAVVDAIDPRLLAQLVPRQAARAAKLVAHLKSSRVGLDVRCFPMKGHSELAIAAPDMPGVLAAIAGVLAAHRVDVLGAILGSASTAIVLDVFFVRDLKGEAIAEDDVRWPKLLADLRALLPNTGVAPDQAAVAALIAKRRPPSGLPKRVTPGVKTEIKIVDDSAQATIIEVATRDRVGVLYAITHAIAELGLDISLAKVATEGEKVADVFYVTRNHARITDAAERATIIARLAEAAEKP